jgi:predicted metal-dependent hydrolase
LINVLKSLWFGRPAILEPGARTLQYGEREISYSLHRGNGRRLRLMVRPDLEVRVYAPRRASERDIIAAVHSKAPWIVKQLDNMKKLHPLPAPHHYMSGETFLYLGQPYRLRVEQGARTSVVLDGASLCVTLVDPGNTASARRALSEWYRKQAMQCFTERLTALGAVSARHRIPPPQTLRVRQMRTRWGSCSRAGKITLNIALVESPVQCVDYVIMHELCHLIHHNHSTAFYHLLTACMPDWQERKQSLKTMSLAH